MKKFTWMVIILSALCSPQVWGINSTKLTANQSLKYPVIVRVYFEHAAQIQPIADQYDVWTINQTQKFVLVQLADDTSFQQLLKHGLTMRLDHKQMQKNAIDLSNIAQAKEQGSGIPGFACYSTVAETMQKMEQMDSTYPNLVELIDIGDSWEKIQDSNTGEDLRIIKLTNESITTEKPILFMASSIHAREYATAELNTRFAQYLVNNYGTDADVTWILDNHEIHLSLVTNPDGRKQAQSGILWRKNTNNNHCANSNNRGVDLNRNYPFEWAIGGSNSACSEVYYGPSESSEPEITAQMDHLRNIYDDNRGPGANDAAPDDTAGIFVDIHSFSQLILWPWGYTNNVTANDNQLQALGKRVALFNQYRPQPVNDLVITGGNSIDAIYGELGVASLAFELGTAFFQDCETFEAQILPDNLNALLYLARVTQAPYTQPLGPDVENLIAIPNVITAATTIQVSGVANDNRYNQSNGAQTTGTIQSVTAYLNDLPINGINGQPLTPFDGNFNTVSEAFEGSINTNNLPAGKNLLYVQASDGTQGGGTYAQFIDVVEPGNVAQLSGSVTDASNGLPVSNALLNINQSQTLSISDGSYSQWVQPGTTNLVVSASGYANQTIANLSLSAGSQVVQNVQLQPFCDIYFDDIENGNLLGWVADSPWAISSELSSSPTMAWSDSPGGDYDNNLDVSLTSAPIDVTDADSLEVSYMSVCDTEATFDFGHFEVQFNGGAWQEISQCDNQANWQREVEVLTIPNGATELKLRFRLTSDTAVTENGWHIDDVVVRASGVVCGFINPDIIFADGFE
ncbi:hypothetical protein MNBD_GAMMA02-995 [hydrothermal vent metagenome]|uniref:Peptidase M14 domain-containing protein n=1 Tax=hydrothermal vent metagenome TaxID=652676 RepID=A0A3B0VXI6_9ZZZZ